MAVFDNAVRRVAAASAKASQIERDRAAPRGLPLSTQRTHSRSLVFNVPMQFLDVVLTIGQIRSTTSRTAKAHAVAECLAAASMDEIGVVAAFLSGRLAQRRTGVGWASLTDLPEPAQSASLSVSEVDSAMASLQALSGSGSAAQRASEVARLFAAATAPEQSELRALMLGDLRAGAKEATVVEGISRAFEIPLAQVRRAVMLTGSAPRVAQLAAAGADLTGLTLEVGSPAHPMLASSAPSVSEAVSQVGLPCVVDAKLDGIRVQVHRQGDQVSVWSRTLDDLTGRFPDIEDAVLALPVHQVVLDGEGLSIGADGRPSLFQDTAAGMHPLRPFVFDVLHIDGEDLHDQSLAQRRARLEQVVPDSQRPFSQVVSTHDEAEAVWTSTLAAGHEGVVVKSLDGRWEAGRRGAGWIKVKPRHTFDLVVLAVEWGSGRRRGHLSNIHLGARTDDGFVMVGKTFKGMTDAMLAWQTARFLELETHREGHVVYVEPVQVVEIAIDGLQRSRRYPGGVALRFARVLGYRHDKSAEHTDTLETLKAPFGVS